MVILSIPRKAVVVLTADGWTVQAGQKVFEFSSFPECLCFLAGRKYIRYDDIKRLLCATRERFS